MYSLKNKNYKKLMFYTILFICFSSDIYIFSQNHPWGECVYENVKVSSKTIGENHIYENQLICRYRYNMYDPLGEWIIKEE